jgi:hypothetical protein
MMLPKFSHFCPPYSKALRTNSSKALLIEKGARVPHVWGGSIERISSGNLLALRKKWGKKENGFLLPQGRGLVF